VLFHLTTELNYSIWELSNLFEPEVTTITIMNKA
jgi:hypothetical protein